MLSDGKSLNAICKDTHSKHYGYTQFKNHVQSYVEAHSYSYHNTYVPGEEWQIDFAGDALYLTGKKTGELTKVTAHVII